MATTRGVLAPDLNFSWLAAERQSSEIPATFAQHACYFEPSDSIRGTSSAETCNSSWSGC